MSTKSHGILSFWSRWVWNVWNHPAPEIPAGLLVNLGSFLPKLQLGCWAPTTSPTVGEQLMCPVLARRLRMFQKALGLSECNDWHREREWLRDDLQGEYLRLIMPLRCLWFALICSILDVVRPLCFFRDRCDIRQEALLSPSGGHYLVIYLVSQFFRYLDSLLFSFLSASFWKGSVQALIVLGIPIPALHDVRPAKSTRFCWTELVRGPVTRIFQRCAPAQKSTERCTLKPRGNAGHRI